MRVVPMRRATSPRLGRTNHAHRDLGVAARQVFVPIGDRELDRDARMLDPKRGEDRRQHFAADDLARGHADHAPVDRRLRRGGARQSGRGDRHRLSVRRKRQRSGRRREAPRRSGEEGEAQRVFQSVDVAPDSRLGDAEPASRAGQAAVPHDLEEGAQFVPGRVPSDHTQMYGCPRRICNSAGPLRALRLLPAGGCTGAVE